MIRMFLSAALILGLAGLIGAQNPDPNAKQKTDAKEKADKGQKATITKVDAKNGTITVQMKDKNGKETEKIFKLTGDIRYFDSTGKVVAIDLFRSGDDVLVVEAEGNLKEMHKKEQGRAAQANGKLGQVDSEFLHLAAEVNMAEMKLGKLAQDRATAANLKQYGQRLVTDHTKMSAELQKIAQKEDATLPGKLDEKHQDLFDQLSKVNGATFDTNFSKDMIKGHEHAIAKFETQAKNGQDAELKAYAEKWLPTLRDHLQTIKNAGNQGK
jgi:putative membrane protein